MHKLVRFSRLPAVQRGLLLRASILLLTFKVSLKLLPFRRTRALVQRLARPVSRRKTHALTPDLVRWTVTRAGRVLHTTCLPNALSAYVLLQRAGYPAVLRIGVYQDEKTGAITAHAWVQHGDTIIVGEVDDLARFTPLPDLWPKS